MTESHTDLRERLRSQIEEAYCKALYTYTTQHKAANLKERGFRLISIAQILLTSISSVSFISMLVTYQNVATVLAGLCSVVSLALNLYSRGRDYPTEIELHRSSADELWPVMQDYVSLLTDFDDLDIWSIRENRKLLQDRLESIYKRLPATNSKAYLLAQKALKQEAEQTFEIGECDRYLPVGIRRSGDKASS